MVAKPDKSDWLTIGQVAERTGLAASAIRFYEAEGLVRAERDRAGQRRFRRAEIRRISFITVLQSFGFTLAEIRAELSKLPQARTPSATDWRKLSTGFRDRLQERIDRLTRLRDNLDGCIGCGCLSMDRCALVNIGDRAARLGPGARFVVGAMPDP